MDVRSIRGTHDILPGSVELWQRIESTVRALFPRYGFDEIRTPVLEETELFTRSIGGETDIVQKEMFTLEDTRGNRMSLRPEGTAPVVRSYLEHNLQALSSTIKLYYMGPMFRRERPQKGRYRQFHQLGAEVLGTDHPAVEAEVLEMLTGFLSRIGLREYRLLVNSVGCANCRPAFVALLRRQALLVTDQLCGQCHRRLESNPLRIFDCKVPSCQPWIAELPTIDQHWCEECQTHYAGFKSYLDLHGLEYAEEPRLVRGLDYYVRTTFEIISDQLGPTQNALVGGGRYDGLAEILGGTATRGFGFAMGLERLVLLLSGRDSIQSPFQLPVPDLILIYFDEETFRAALSLQKSLREHGIRVEVDFAARSLKAQLRWANRVGARFTCVLGENELQSGEMVLKQMLDGEQIPVSRESLTATLLDRLSS